MAHRARRSCPARGQWRIAIALALAPLAVACADGASPRLSPLAPDAVILAFGDSLTAGNGAPASESYPVQLDRRLAQRVIGSGVPGETTAAGLRRLPEALDRHDPALLLLCLGGNDFLRRGDPADTEANLDRMIGMARARGIAVVLLGVPRPRPLPGVGDALYIRLAEAHGIPLENEVISEVLSEGALRSDPIHPNAEGYAKMAAAIEHLLSEAGAL
jgi:lysophospholipase L1-like esterase